MQVKLKTADLAVELEDWCQLVDKQNKIVIFTFLQFFSSFLSSHYSLPHRVLVEHWKQAEGNCLKRSSSSNRREWKRSLLTPKQRKG